MMSCRLQIHAMIFDFWRKAPLYCRVKGTKLQLINDRSKVFQNMRFELTTCETYQLKTPIKKGSCLNLDSVSGLEVGDHIYICSTFMVAQM